MEDREKPCGSAFWRDKFAEGQGYNTSGTVAVEISKQLEQLKHACMNLRQIDLDVRYILTKVQEDLKECHYISSMETIWLKMSTGQELGYEDSRLVIRHSVNQKSPALQPDMPLETQIAAVAQLSALISCISKEVSKQQGVVEAWKSLGGRARKCTETVVKGARN